MYSLGEVNFIQGMLDFGNAELRKDAKAPSYNRAYVQFRGNEFHTRNAQSRQLQEQRRAKAHSRQAIKNIFF